MLRRAMKCWKLFADCEVTVDKMENHVKYPTGPWAFAV